MNETEQEMALKLLAEPLSAPYWDLYLQVDWMRRVEKFLAELTSKPRL
jgi:hypothetical protein